MRLGVRTLLLPVLLLVGCSDKLPEPDPADIQRARRAATTFDVRLHNEILERLEREPPETVQLLYRSRAPMLAGEVADEFDVGFRRTSFRVRNPANAPDDWEYEKLEALEFSIEAGLDSALLEFSEVVEGQNGDLIFRWIRPIIMTEDCLVCHGDQVPVEILDLLDAEYPNDDATGYFAYELGGAYSVSRPLDR